MEITSRLLTFSLQVPLKSVPSLMLAWKSDQIIEAFVAKVNPDQKTVLLQLPEGQVEARSELPLRPGTQLQLSAEPREGQWILRVRNTTTPAETWTAALRRALPRETPTGPLFQTVARLLRAPQALPQPVRAQLQALVNAYATPTRLSKPESLHAALQNSGLLLEAHLADPAAPPPAADIKARLLSLWVALQANVRREAPLPSPAPAATPMQPDGEMGHSNDPSAPQKSATSRNESAATVAPDEGVELEGVLKQVEGALSRIQLHQLRAAPQDGQQQPQWLFELPVRTDQGAETLQLRFEREAEREGNGTSMAGGWRVTLDLSHPEFGHLRAVVVWHGGAITTRFFGERAATVDLFRRNMPALTARLTAAGITVGSMEAHEGLPVDTSRPIGAGLLSERA